MEIAAYLLEIQFWCCPAVGNLYPIFKPHRGAFAAFPKQNDKYLTNAREGGGGGGYGHARASILPGKLSSLCNIQYRNKTARKSFENIGN